MKAGSSGCFETVAGTGGGGAGQPGASPRSKHEGSSRSPSGWLARALGCKEVASSSEKLELGDVSKDSLACWVLFFEDSNHSRNGRYLVAPILDGFESENIQPCTVSRSGSWPVPGLQPAPTLSTEPTNKRRSRPRSTSEPRRVEASKLPRVARLRTPWNKTIPSPAKIFAPPAVI